MQDKRGKCRFEKVKAGNIGKQPEGKSKKG